MGERMIDASATDPAVIHWRDFDPSWLPGGADAPLATEYTTYRNQLDELLRHEGDYVVIKSQEIVGIYPNQLHALKVAGDFAPTPVLVKQIVETEPVRHLGGVAF